MTVTPTSCVNQIAKSKSLLFDKARKSASKKKVEGQLKLLNFV